jgi:ABC-type amino acid transport substrate-binding protein
MSVPLIIAKRRPDRWGWIALAILLGYIILVISTERGVGVAGQGLDPIWAAAQLGLRAEFVPSGLDSIYDDLAAGKADIAASALPYAPEQGWRVMFSEFYFNAGQVLVVPRGADANFSRKRIGVALGSDADTYARNLAIGQSVILSSSYETPADAFAALRRGELDAVISDHLAALIALNTMPEFQIAQALTLEPYAIAMPVAGFRMRAEVNRALADLQREGFFEQNGAKWFRDP